MKRLNEQVNADEIDNIMEDMAENEQQRQEINEIFESVALEGQEEYLEELDRLEAEVLGNEIQGNIVNSNPI